MSRSLILSAFLCSLWALYSIYSSFRLPFEIRIEGMYAVLNLSSVTVLYISLWLVLLYRSCKLTVSLDKKSPDVVRSLSSFESLAVLCGILSIYSILGSIAALVLFLSAYQARQLLNAIKKQQTVAL